jgi:hypothetical protein
MVSAAVGLSVPRFCITYDVVAEDGDGWREIGYCLLGSCFPIPAGVVGRKLAEWVEEMGFFLPVLVGDEMSLADQALVLLFDLGCISASSARVDDTDQWYNRGTHCRVDGSYESQAVHFEGLPSEVRLEIRQRFQRYLDRTLN